MTSKTGKPRKEALPAEPGFQAEQEDFLSAFSARLSRCASIRKGQIHFRLAGPVGGDFCLDCAPGETSVSRTVPAESPTIEVFGDARRIRMILEGKKDARTQFLAGGIRLRGDLRYASDLMMELGILDKPL